MRRWLQRIRGAVGLGLTWAAGWAPIGAGVGVALHVAIPGAPVSLGTVVALNATTFAVLGFVGGTIFAGILGLTGGHRRFEELRIRGSAAWGAIGGALLGSIAVMADLWGAGFGLIGAGMMGAAALLGAASAAGSLALARSASDQELLESDTGVTDSRASRLSS
jgi:hypothetical protein